MATRNKVMKSYALDQDLLARLEEWIASQHPAPSRTAVIEASLGEWLDRVDERPRKTKKPNR